jgi:hypothetical protein
VLSDVGHTVGLRARHACEPHTKASTQSQQ